MTQARRPQRTWTRTALGGALLTVGAAALASPLPPVESPPENPLTEPKRVLGKILFWEEQLSSDDTVACGTCHLPGRGGADPRRVRHPGADGVQNTPDDAFGSPGVVRRDAAGDFLPHAAFGLAKQVTGRGAPSSLTGAFANHLFWDGRGTSRFVDPETGAVAIASGGALESQAAGPPLSDVEMASAGRTWADVTTKLAAAAPLALATNLPADVGAAIDARPTYPQLFAAAFGDPAITARRIAFAIAAYERTLVPDRTPWDRFMDGDLGALTPQQVRGWNAFQASRCNDCHAAPEFTDRSFRNIGLRPPAEDTGRQAVTGDPTDRGLFKVPSLRNAGLRLSFMHGGQFTSLTDVLRFYARAPGAPAQFAENRDPLMPQVNVPPNAAADIEALLRNGLTDPRAAAETFPFDRPTLASQRADRVPAVGGGGRPGTGGRVPAMAAPMPPFLGNAGFRLGVANALPGAQATLAVSSSPPVSGEVSPATVLGPVTLGGSGAGGGYGTMAWPVPADLARDGETVWFQWRVGDPAAANGIALSPPASATLFAVRTLPVDEPVATIPVDDARLALTTASFVVDWAAHAAGRAADVFAAQGALNPLGATSAEGAELVVEVAGAEVLRATLDAAGRARSARRVAPAWSASFDVATGRFSASAGGLDLRAATGLTPDAERTAVQLDVAVRVTGAGLATPAASGAFAFDARTRPGRSSRGEHRYARDGAASGVFAVQSARVRTAADGTRSVVVSGVLDRVAEGAFSPSASIALRLGDATTIDLPVASFVVRGDGAAATFQASAAAPATRLTWSGRKRTFTLVADGLPSSLLPDGGSTSASLEVVLSSPTDAGIELYGTTVGLRRPSPFGRVWSR